MAYNRYRKRHYNISKTKARNYAEEMDKLADSFINGQYKDWSISTMMDSCYHTFDDPMVTIRLSNHSADNKYHDLSGDSSDYVLVNIKSSKLEFTDKIDNFVPTVLEKLKEVDLKKYRYINIINDNMNCYYRGFKTKKDSFEISSQMSEIEEGLESKVDASLYADPKEEKAPESSLKDLVSNDIKKSVDISMYADSKFNNLQMRQIREGLEKGLDVSVYADTKFDSLQMNQIRWGLERDLDVSVYADPKFNGWQMSQIRQGLQNNVDVSLYADTKLDDSQMQQIREGLESKVDVSAYADLKEEKAPESSLKDLVSNDIKNSVDVNRYYEVDAWQEKIEQLEGAESISRFALDEDVEEFYDAHKTEIESKIDGMSKLLDLDKESILGISDESSKIDYKRSASIVAYHLSMTEIKNDIENGSFQIPPMSEEQENKLTNVKTLESSRNFEME
ncbi:hypothetical protein [Enterococcus cecorum]|uniref:hypothetical protein n=1 Tax=Enterococcus cecorum TaxID=44008 RepID=UPI0006992A33|nr:hypothetical protein [Enterococcus cecorum]